MVRPIDFGAGHAHDTSLRRGSHAVLGVPVAAESAEERQRRAENQQNAIREYDRAVQALRQQGITVISFDKHLFVHDFCGVRLPDGVFVNNWISTDGDGNVVLYPLHQTSRNLEKFQFRYVLEQLLREGFDVRSVHNFAHEGLPLEGTGAVVFDHAFRRAYCAFSERANSAIFAIWCQKFGFEGFGFDAGPRSDGRAQYDFTNTILAIGQTFIVVCEEAIAAQDRERVLRALESTGRDLLRVTREQAEKHHCCNILQLQDCSERSLIIVSARANKGFTQQQRAALEKHGQLVVLDLSTIEEVGSGSVRSIMAEIFLPRRLHTDRALTQ